MAIRALVSADRSVVRIWHPNDAKVYVETQLGPEVPPSLLARADE
jgi:hypothetical protein